MPHDHPHPHDHNHADGHHLHSHTHDEDPTGDLQILASEFIEGFTTARDKAAFLRLAGVPLEIADVEGGAPLKLVDVALTTEWQVGTASPSFGSSELCYLPFPGDMIEDRSNLSFVYVSASRKETVDLREFVYARENSAA